MITEARRADEIVVVHVRRTVTEVARREVAGQRPSPTGFDGRATCEPFKAVAVNTGPESPQDFKNNIMAMVEIAKANNITVLLGSIPPTAHFSWRPTVNPVPWVASLNDWLRGYAKRMNIRYVDYLSALVGKSGEFRPALSNDGVHPNRDGFAIMRRIVEPMLSGRH